MYDFVPFLFLLHNIGERLLFDLAQRYAKLHTS
jgi:hypothetical protein